MGAAKVSKPLAWVGSVTAVFSLIAGVYGGWKFVSDRIEKRRALDRLLAVEAVQLRTSDYESAWKTLTQAAAIDAGSSPVEQAREDVAMRWLEEVHASGGRTFSSITEMLEPVLTRGASSAKSPQRQADLLAHIGWSYFLRSRETPSGPDPELAYRDALSKDPANPYAHAMWGHWILWTRHDVAKSGEHFAAALAAPRPALRGYVRFLQLAALQNARTPEAARELVRVADEMRRKHEDLDPAWPRRLLGVYRESLYPPDDHTAAFLKAVPPEDHLATYDWLVQLSGAKEADPLIQAYIHSALLEAAGRREEALAGYRALDAALKRDGSPTLIDLAHRAVFRLTAMR